MTPHAHVTELGHAGPRLLLLPGLGNRGSGFRSLARILAETTRPVLVEYPTGTYASTGPGDLAREVARAAGPADGAIASSLGGLVATHLVASGAVKGVAYLCSFSKLAHLGLRAHLLRAMGPIAAWGRPGRFAAIVAAHGPVDEDEAPHVVPMSALERETTWLRAFATHRDPHTPPVPLHAPCIALHGDRDWLVPPSTLGRLVRDLPAGTPFHMIRGAGHVPYFSHPGEVARLLAPWIARVGESR